MATPRAASSSVRQKTALVAPRILKAPTFWRFSHLKRSSAPHMASRALQAMTGVRWTRPRIRFRAAATSSGVGGGRVMSTSFSWFHGTVRRGSMIACGRFGSETDIPFPQA